MKILIGRTFKNRRIGLVLTIIVMVVLCFNTNNTNADEQSDIEIKWENSHLSIEEIVNIDGVRKIFIWDYWRNDNGHWRKELRSIDGQMQNNNYYMIYNGDTTTEYIPQVDSYIISKNNDGKQVEANVFIQPQLTERIKDELSRNPSLRTMENEEGVKILKDQQNNVSYWMNFKNQVIKYEKRDSGDVLQKAYRIIDYTDLNNQKNIINTKLITPIIPNNAKVHYLPEQNNVE
ncbi:hypothetical protein PAEVO_16270 [Paenibacillus sp. GM2FR]|uniref:hypothetical protein n=1 Tax=Paenibacillus TaxID=44249 RepID=UPI000C275045|nr:MULTISPECIES: hypothetical protein [Paenibacillus]MEC0258622.1 hypothetical protein [Paenibacillus lautus]PJN54906.1 hypothetical protein PAEVO_16270 [Paenibacillus sp. GM2FR]